MLNLFCTRNAKPCECKVCIYDTLTMLYVKGSSFRVVTSSRGYMKISDSISISYNFQF